MAQPSTGTIIITTEHKEKEKVEYRAYKKKRKLKIKKGKESLTIHFFKTNYPPIFPHYGLLDTYLRTNIKECPIQRANVIPLLEKQITSKIKTVVLLHQSTLNDQ